jgi:hypothetical protein
MATTYTGIVHLKINGAVACKRPALLAVQVAAFRKDAQPCVRCAAKLRQMDALALRRIAADPAGWVAA